MKALAWYSFVLSVGTIIAFCLSLIGVIGTPPFSIPEQIVWAALLIPVAVFALEVARNRD